MIEFAILAVIISLVSAFIITLGYKWGIIEWMQIHAKNDFIAELMQCNFCISFWVNLTIAIIASVVMWDVAYMLIPFCSTIITRNLL